jgi:predicted DNA-binding transcriptional regulator YafY
MRRADRLFQIVQRLRRRGKVVTAAQLADELDVSERTVYRDVADLMGSGVPIEAEAGVGYRLQRGAYDLPPLMFDEDEIEALVLGARVVKEWSDPALARAAESALAKIEAVVPTKLKERFADASLFALNFRREQKEVAAKLGTLRGAIRAGRVINLDYVDRAAQPTTRAVWPLGLFYWGAVWTVGAWCELRGGFRSFRVDRIDVVQVTETRFPSTPGRTLRDLFAYCRTLPSAEQ